MTLVKTLIALLSAAVLAGCASRSDKPVVVDTPRMQVTRALIYKKIDGRQLRQVLTPDGRVRAAGLVPAVGKGMADLVAGELEDLFARTTTGRAFVAKPDDALSGFVVRTEDDRDITVLSDYARFVVGSCVKLFEAPDPQAGPRIVPASGCAR